MKNSLLRGYLVRSSVFVCAFVFTVLLVTAADEISPGPFQDKRNALFQSIKDMEKAGVGIKPYLQSFTSIDNMVKTGSPEAAILPQIERLSEAISAQQQAARKQADLSKPRQQASGTDFTGPEKIASYCISVAKLVNNYWKPVNGVDDSVVVDVDVDAAGNVLSASLAKTSKGATPAQERVLNVVKRLKNLGVPPATSLPLQLQISDCEKHGVEVIQSNIDYSQFMQDLQRRIKRAWFPPKREEYKRTTVIFKVWRNGAVSHVRIGESSGDVILDEAAIKAVNNASPARPLPGGSPDNIDIDFALDYKPKNQIR
jgi:TonB family protein